MTTNKDSENTFLKSHRKSLKKYKLKSEIVGTISLAITLYSSFQINGEILSIAGDDLIYQGIRLIGLIGLLYAITNFIDFNNQLNNNEKDSNRLNQGK